MSKPLRLRPFREHLERERHLTMLEVSGRIEGRRFVVAAIGCEVGFDTIDVGQDQRGPYALVAGSEHILPNGFKVRIELEPDEYLPPGAVIEIILEGRARDEARQRLLAQGVAPDLVTVLASYERFFSVNFDSLGLVNGRASSYVDDRRGRTTPS